MLKRMPHFTEKRFVFHNAAYLYNGGEHGRVWKIFSESFDRYLPGINSKNSSGITLKVLDNFRFILAGIDDYRTLGAQPLGHIDRFQQSLINDHHIVRLIDI